MTHAFAALIVAAGRGLRAGGATPKQYRAIGGEPVLCRALRPFLDAAAIGPVIVVTGPGDEPLYRDAQSRLAGADTGKLLPPVLGGNTRQASVHAGLRALASAGFSGTVLVHDAARPFLAADLLGRALESGRLHAASVPTLAVTDTIKQIDDGGTIAATLRRDRLAAVQTPQVFAFAPLLAAHEAAIVAGETGFTDDSAIMEWAGHAVATFAGDPMNLKLTHPGDFLAAENSLGMALVSRTGIGYDVHAFTEGDHAWIGGVRIDHDRGVLAHSDGDVGLHALTDALLGALAEGDIGTHFPPSDPQWRGASSDRFLAYAAERVSARGGRIDLLDLTIICETPKVGPHREAIRRRIAGICAVGEAKVSVKATTSERLGFTGRREGLAAMATATIRLPDQE